MQDRSQSGAAGTALPTGVIRVKKRPQVYPAQVYAQAATKSLVEHSLREFCKSMKDTPAGAIGATWDKYKTHIRAEMTKLKRQVRKRTTSGFRQKIKRLKVQIQSCDEGKKGNGERRKGLVEAMRGIQNLRRAQKRRTLIACNAFRSKATTKAFFRRISTKYGDNTIPTLQPTDANSTRNLHDKANILADSWVGVFNGKAAEKTNINSFIAQYSDKWTKVDMTKLYDEITEGEVEKALAGCKVGKACGPDDLPNTWYRDYGNLLVPIPTKVFNVYAPPEPSDDSCIYSEVVPWPSDVIYIQRNRVPKGIRFASVGNLGKCECVGDCFKDVCLNSITAIYCTPKSCNINGRCSNSPCDRSTLRLFRTRTNGLGTFTTAPMWTGDIVGEYVGQLLAFEGKVDGLPTKAWKYNSGYTLLFNKRSTKNKFIYVEAASCGSITRFINHSFHSNADFIEMSNGTKHKVLVVMNRPVTPGMDITVNYGSDKGFVCHCDECECD